MPQQHSPVPLVRDEEFSPAPYVAAMRNKKLGAQSPLQPEINNLTNPAPFASPAKLLQYSEERRSGT